MNIEQSGILGREGLRWVCERYPELTKALLALDLSEAADSKGGLCRLLETVLKEVRLNEQKKWRVRRGSWTAEVPKGHQGWPLRAPADWLDHPYKMRGEAGEVTYISEPYSLSDDGIRHLARLSDRGWQLSITAWQAIWYPGHTLYIAIRPSDGGKRSLAADIADTYEYGNGWGGDTEIFAGAKKDLRS
jgi:hypothetical protein